MSAILLCGCALLALGAVLPLNRRLTARALDAQLAGAALVAVAALVLVVDGGSLGAPFTDALTPALGLDGLSALLLALVGALGLAALLAARDTLGRAADGPARALAALTAAFLLSLTLVLAARDAVTFLIGWELMTLVPAAAILVARRDAPVRRAVFAYVAISHLGGVGVWVALLTLAHVGALGGTAPHGAAKTLALVAALVGFGTKAGLMPLHAWLPRAHPIAPAHVSALMSAAMVSVALYGLIRALFEWAAPAPAWVGAAMVAVGLLSALGGILYALVQRDLKRLLAFSTIENIGVAAVALGAAVVLAAAGAEAASALAFAAALAQIVGHALAKALLFLGAGALADALGALDLDRLGGLLRRMPATGWAVLVGCAALGGMPPLAGFVAEWLTLQALIRVVTEASAGLALLAGVAIAGLAATAALAALCFAKVVGLVLLGVPRTPRAASAQERPPATRAALILLGVLCGAFALAAGAVAPTLAELAPGTVHLPAQPGLGVSLPGAGGLTPPALALALIVGVALLAAWVRGPRAASAPAWTCGQRVEPPLAWTSAGFTKPLRLMLAAALRPRREVAVDAHAGVVREVLHRAEVPHHFDGALYAPVRRAALRAAAVARRLQSGSLRAYLAYLMAVLLAVLALARLGGAG